MWRNLPSSGDRRLSACRRGTCDQGVAGEGGSRARLMLVDEKPGDHEDPQGKPFVGPAGRLLRELCEGGRSRPRMTTYRGGQALRLGTSRQAPTRRRRGREAGRATGRRGRPPVSIVAEVVAVDAAKQTIALKGPQRTVELRIPNPEQFKRISKGDQVEATFTQAVAIAVQPMASK